MTADQVTELEQRIAQLENQVDELEDVLTELEDVEAVGLGRGSEQAISILATYVSEVAAGFDLAEFLRRPRTVRGPRPVRLRVKGCEGAVPEEAGRQDQGADLTVSRDRRVGGLGFVTNQLDYCGGALRPATSQLMTHLFLRGALGSL